MAKREPLVAPSTQKEGQSPPYGGEIWVSYKISPQPLLPSLFRTVARFFGFMTSPTPSPFKEEFAILNQNKVGFDRVEGFCTHLSNLYKSAKTCMIDRHRWKVVKISTYKSKNSFQHESLVAEVVCGEHSLFLRMDRKIYNSAVGQSSKGVIPKTSSEDSDTTLDDAGSLHGAALPPPTPSSNKIATDEVHFSRSLLDLVSKKEEGIDSVVFKGEKMSLPQLAVLARCVNKLGQTYHLFGQNCYWFARVVVETAKKIHPSFETVPSGRERGSWNGVPTKKKPPEKLIEEVKNSYDKEWKEFEDDVYDSVNNVNSEIYQNVLHQKEEAERREEEQRRKREEAERHNEMMSVELAELRALKAHVAAQNAHRVPSHE